MARIIEFFTQKFVIKLSKIWVWDPGSEGQKDTGSRVGNTAEPPLPSLFKQIFVPVHSYATIEKLTVLN